MKYMEQLMKSLLLCLLITTAGALEYQSYGEFTRPQLTQIIEVVSRVLGGD